jgi:hypothetical protein
MYIGFYENATGLIIDLGFRLILLGIGFIIRGSRFEISLLNPI